MMGTIGLRNLRLDCVIGVYAEERRAARQLHLDVALDTDFQRASVSERLEDTIDYGDVSEHLVAFAADHRFRLLEAFVRAAAISLLERFPAAQRVALEVRKPRAAPAVDDCFVRFELVR